MTLDETMLTLVEKAVEKGNAPLLNKIDALQKKVQSLLGQMTIREAAEYVGVSEQSIRNWSDRAEEDNPFPIRYAGSDPRFIRAEIDEWEIREAKRRSYKRREDRSGDDISGMVQ